MIGLYIFNMLPYCISGLIIFLLGSIKRYKSNKVNFKREILLALFVAYSFGLASQTILPHINIGISTATRKPFIDIYLHNSNSSINIIPFKTIVEQLKDGNDMMSLSSLNLLGNIFLFSPVGFFIPLLAQRKINLKKIIAIGFSLSIFIEFVQLFIGRSSDIDDVLLNTFGVVIGYIVLIFGQKIHLLTSYKLGK